MILFHGPHLLLCGPYYTVLSYCIIRRLQTEDAWYKYRATRNQITESICDLHARYHNHLFAHEELNQKKILQAAREDQRGTPILNLNGRVITTSADMAIVLNNRFHAVFTNEDLTHQPTCSNSPHTYMPNIAISTDGAQNLLETLDSKKLLHGPDNIPTYFVIRKQHQF